MELTNDIEVNAPVEEVWAAFNDPERIAPCLPGAQLQEIEGEEMRGLVKVKVGPITAQYKGAATYQERDKDNWNIVIKGDGRGSSGNASAIITAKLDPVDAATTKVNVHTDLTITGKVAQFGRGAIGDVSTKLMGQFADNLETLIEEGGAAPADESARASEASSPGAAPVVRKIDSPEAEAVDLLEVAGTPMIKRLALPLGILFVLIVLRRMLPRLNEGRPVAAEADIAAVKALLGRAPQSDFEVVVRDLEGLPRVIRNAPFLEDGTPMPTRYWLVGEHDRLVVSRLESTGAVRQAEADIAPELVQDAHDRYAAERDAAIDARHTGPRPSGGVGGTRRGLKCLHAHYAWYLAGGDDPAGRWVADALARGHTDGAGEGPGS